MIKINSLKNRLLFICSIIIITSLILCLVTIILVRDLVIEDLEEHNTSILDLTYNQIEDHVQFPLQQLEQLVESLTIEELDRYLSVYLENNLLINSVSIANLDAEIIHVSPSLDHDLEWNTAYDPAYNKANMKTWSWSQSYISKSTGETVISASKLLDDKVIIAEIQMRKTPINIFNEQLFGEDIRVEVLDEWGIYILSSDKEKVDGRYRMPHFDAIKYSVTNDKYSGKYVNDSDDEGISLLYQYNEIMSWYVLVHYDSYAINRSILDWYIIITIIWSTFSIVLVFAIIKYFTSANHDIERLVDRTENVSKGNYELNKSKFNFIEFESLDTELYRMAEILNNRTDEIVSINSSLEKVVYARTVELNNTNVKLKAEITERELIEDEIRQINKFLDRKVKERTYELEVTNKELNKSVREAYKANKAKGDFLAVMSHEMRTPLNGIIGFTHMLSMEIDNPEHIKTLDLVLSSSKVLLTLINDVLDVSKYDAGQMQFEKNSFNLGNEVYEVLESFKVLTEVKGVSFFITGDDLGEINVLSDQTKIKQVFYNLLNNALKFTDEGSITVMLNCTLINEKYKLDVKISDTGIGMANNGNDMFEPFTQADDTIHRNYGGTGLGLTITKEILTAFEGNIEFESDLDVGTTCHFTMYLDQSTSGITEYRENNNILIVEDHIVNQTLMTKFCEKFDVNYDLAVNGQEAVAMAQENDYDLILMDCQMPVMNGFDATRRIREFDSNIFIVAMTAYTSPEDKQKCLDAGMNEFMSKPIDFKRLKSLIGASDYKEVMLKSNNQDILTPHVENLMSAIGFDAAMCRELIETFIDQLNTAIEKIEISFAINDFVTIEKILHQMKGASGTVRLNKINDYIIKIENLFIKKSYDEALDVLLQLKKEDIIKKDA